MPARAGKLFLGITFCLLVGVANDTRGQAPIVPNSRLGTRTVPMLLLGRPDVQGDVGLNAAQISELNQVSLRLYHKAKSLLGKTDQATLEARKAIDQEQLKWLTTRLTDDQKKRLVQIDLQWEGASSVNRAGVAEMLGLTTEQREVLKRLTQEWDRERHAATPKPSEVTAYSRKVMAILSEPQRELWKEMLGRPFTPQIVTAIPNPPAGAEKRKR